MGKRGQKQRKGTGWHIQRKPQDKFSVDWRPRWGGKKAAKEKALYTRKFEEFLSQFGVPAPAVPPSSVEPYQGDWVDEGVESDDSGFPDFPGSVDLIEEDLTEVIIEEDPVEVPQLLSIEDRDIQLAIQDVPPQRESLELDPVGLSFGSGPSGDTQPPSKLRLPRAKVPKSVPVPAIAPAPKAPFQSTKVDTSGSPAAAAGSKVEAAESSTSRETTRILKSLRETDPDPVGVPKASRKVPVPEPAKPPVKKGEGVSVPEPKGPPPKKIPKEPGYPPPKRGSLADVVIDLSGSDPSAGIDRYTPEKDCTEVRFVLDYNGTSNTDRPGGRQLDRLYNDTVQAIVQCLKNSPKHRVGICSDI